MITLEDFEIEIEAKDKDYRIIWNTSKQKYTIYYKNKFFASGYRYRDIINYM
jgi:predicted mannosyl-3-phosphoglycerate phosphatase (HAD superfamily)